MLLEVKAERPVALQANEHPWFCCSIAQSDEVWMLNLKKIRAPQHVCDLPGASSESNSETAKG